eukprot:gene10150-18815_t
MAKISNSTYYAIQHAYLIPSVIAVWHESQKKMFQFLHGRDVVLGGDARMDSPGHMAKYGSYSLMDLGTSMILDTQLIQSNEVGGENRMELEGLKRALQKIEDNVSYNILATDRHGPGGKFTTMYTWSKGTGEKKESYLPVY